MESNITRRSPFDNMSDRGATGTSPWTRYEISMDVPKDASNINFGVIHPGDGEAWFDSLQVEIDGQPYTAVDSFDLDFEAPTLRAFYTGGQGYDVTIDSSTAHTGKQSLHSKYLGRPIDGKLVVQDCRTAVNHLASDRAALISAGASAKEVDWAIQNARLVLQYAQLLDGEKSRDESMADNIEWIADQNPGAKVVIWAHNLHVGYSPYSGISSMGGYLRNMFGPQMMNFGFAFNQGSFQSKDMSDPQQKLRNFTVDSAPEGSLDRALAATKIPIFALDLRHLPKDGPVSQWFSQPHRSRSVGSGYSDALAPRLWSETPIAEEFDALLFVEKTTAARPN